MTRPNSDLLFWALLFTFLASCPEPAPWPALGVEKTDEAPSPQPPREGPFEEPSDAGPLVWVFEDAGFVELGAEDSGVLVDAGSWQGTDAGDSGHAVDGGPDSGRRDAGAIAFPNSPGWSFFGPQHGGPLNALGVSSDSSGNLWVAGGEEGLFLLVPGSSTFRRFTRQDGLAGAGLANYPVLSVKGAGPGVVYVGYQGLFAGQEENDPPALIKSGDADLCTLDGGALSVAHLDLSTPPGVDPHYPAGRDKIRSVFRIAVNPATGDAWFGGNHGVAFRNGLTGEVQEHQHAAINGFLATGEYTLLSGDWYGLAVEPSGDVWIGGGHRTAKCRFASEGRNFWASLDPVLDLWPDLVPVDGQPNQRADDFVQDMALEPDGTLWVGSIPNGLVRVAAGQVVPSNAELVNTRVSALEADPADGSIWVGHLFQGITRLGPRGAMYYGDSTFGAELAWSPVSDLQSDRFSGKRRILVAFWAGAIGVYTGD